MNRRLLVIEESLTERGFLFLNPIESHRIHIAKFGGDPDGMIMVILIGFPMTLLLKKV